METFTLLEQTPGCTDPDRKALVEELLAIRRRELRIFYTYAPRKRETDGNALSFVFTTTHKDTHLRFGEMSFKGLRHLGSLLEKAFQNGRRRQVLVLKGSDMAGGWLVSRYQEGFDVEYNFSPAN